LADGILSTLEVNLDKFFSAVTRGRHGLHERSQQTVVAGIGPTHITRDHSTAASWTTNTAQAADLSE
jgi:hypothetical protein